MEKNQDLRSALSREADEMEYPKLRPVETVQVVTPEGSLFILKDPMEISNKVVAIPFNAFFIISMFDGKHSIRDIQVAYNRKFGQLIFSDKIKDIIFELDAALLMDNWRYRQYIEFLETDFKNKPIRDCLLGGLSYPSQPEQLRSLFEGFFKDLPPDNVQETPVGIVAPHIDFQRGGRTYAAAYRQLSKISSDIFVIFGTSHRPLKNLVALTNKVFSTPFGDLLPHSDFIRELGLRGKTDWFADEFRHKNEHSIEMQAVMLKYIFPDREIRIVPIIVDSLDDLGKKGQLPADDPRVCEFVKAFVDTIDSKRYHPVFIAGVDFAHVGPYFGDPEPPDLLRLKKLEEEELKSITYLEKADAEGFFADVIKDQTCRRVCGLSPLYIMMKVMKFSRGCLLEYRQCSDPDRINNVTVAALSFY